MTWFLQKSDEAAPPPPEVQTPDVPLTTFWQGVSAAFKMQMGDWAIRNEFISRVADDQAATADEVVKRLGQDAVMARLRESGAITPSSEGYDWAFLRYNTDVRNAVLSMGQEAASQDPGGWAGVDFSQSGAEGRVTDQQKREAMDRAAIIAMSPYPVTESVIGGLAGGAADPAQIPLMLINPGSTFLRVLGWQAILNMGATAINLPTRMDTAERLGEPPIDPAQELAFSAAAGAAFAGVFEGAARIPALVRGIRLQAGRFKPPVEGPKALPIEGAVNAAEDAIVNDLPVETAIKAAIPEEMRPAADEPPIDYAARFREDTTTDWEALLREAQSRADEPQVDTAPNGHDAPPDPPTRAEQRAAITSDLNRAEAELAKTSKWFSRYIKKRGGIHPESPIADELRNAGITHKTMPGLFSRKGARDLDNLAIASNDDAMAAIGTDGFYLDRQGVINGLITELTGGRIKTPRDEMLLSQAENARKALREIDLEDQIDTAAGPVTLSPRERTYVKEKIAAGDTMDDAVHDAIVRQFDEAEANRVPDDVYEREADWTPFRDDEFRGQVEGIRGKGAGDLARPDAERGAAGTGTAGAGAAFSVETTPAGQQTLIPGTELRARDTSKAKALASIQAQQSKMRRLDQTSPEGLFAEQQVSMFDDVTSPEATAFMDAQIAEMRAELDPEKSTAFLEPVEADDGRQLKTMDDLVQEIDEMDQMEREFASCLLGGVNVGA